VKQYPPEARIAFYETWACRPDHAYFKEKNTTPQGMQQGIVATYNELSRRYGFPAIPVGEVFQKVLEKRPSCATRILTRKTRRAVPCQKKKIPACGRAFRTENQEIFH